ncbi:MAG: 30S ribosomal protein S27e [archaeon]
MFFIKRIEFAKKPKSFFLRVKCVACGNEQAVFSSANRAVKCLACNCILADSGPGKILLRLDAVKVLKE